MSDDGNVFFANFLSRHHLSSCLQARAASQSSELSSAAEARRRLEEDVSRLRAETDKALKERKKGCRMLTVRNLIFSVSEGFTFLHVAKTYLGPKLVYFRTTACFLKGPFHRILNFSRSANSLFSGGEGFEKPLETCI